MKNIAQQDLNYLSDWITASPGKGQNKLSQEFVNSDSDSSSHPQPILRLDLDFSTQTEGFVAMKKNLLLTLTDEYCIQFSYKGQADIKKFELKIVDPTGSNVWWYNTPHFPISEEWKTIVLTEKDIQFAWGPDGTLSDPLKEVRAIELVFWSDTQKTGTIWFKDLQIIDPTPSHPPQITASSHHPQHPPENILNNSEQGWKSLTPSPRDHNKTEWIEIDLQLQKTIGGLVIHWAPEMSIKKFSLDTSLDQKNWNPVFSSPMTHSQVSYLYLPSTHLRYLRLNLLEKEEGVAFGIKKIEIKNHFFSRSPEIFFKQLARYEKKGSYPRYLNAEQSYWTVVGSPQLSQKQCLINSDGMVEVGKGSFSLEPFLSTDHQWFSWNDVELSTSLEENMPVPTVTWKAHQMELKITTYRTVIDSGEVLKIHYQLTHSHPQTQRIHLHIAARPFQVTPPWQRHLHFGGMTPIKTIALDPNSMRINNEISIHSSQEAQQWGCMAFSQGSLLTQMREKKWFSQSQCEDRHGWATGAWTFSFDLAPNESREVILSIPDNEQEVKASFSQNLMSSAISAWKNKLNQVEISLPNEDQTLVNQLKICAAHVLINRDEEAIQPGPRRYTRSWIRDGALMASAALRMGWFEEAKQFIVWYAQYQETSGQIPWAIEKITGDKLNDPPEHDNLGELIFAIAECYRFTQDRDFLKQMESTVEKAVLKMESLLQESSRTKGFQGLLPESVSHEGYLFQPVHAFWDDFWAVRGLIDACYLAEEGSELKRHLSRYQKLKEELKLNLFDSIQWVIDKNKLAYFPGSVELVDYDPCATAILATIWPDSKLIKNAAFHDGFKKYLNEFVQRHHRGQGNWLNYTPYEVRIIGALCKMGWREEAHQLAQFFVSQSTPTLWHQWPEILWNDLHAPAHIGDLPHSWVGAEYVLSFFTLLYWESVEKNELTLAAGVPLTWLKGDGFKVKNLFTYFGPINYELRWEKNSVIYFKVSGQLKSQTNLMLCPPLPGPIKELVINGRKVNMGSDLSTIPLNEIPVEGRIMC